MVVVNLVCQQVRELGFVEEGATCCPMCHADAERQGIDLIWVRLPNGRAAWVCCNVAQALAAKKRQQHGG